MKRRSEVEIGAIYAQAFPNGTQSERGDAMATELAIEARCCFAFEPTVELMRAAKERGFKIIIVSDTYLDAKQLLALIKAAAGEEVAGLIDRVFASSQVGMSKSQGMLGSVLAAMKFEPRELLHIGDNRKADFDGARALGIPALHLEQFTEHAQRRFRFERSCQQLIGDCADDVRGLMPHRAVLARDEPQAADPIEALGMTVLGPVFYAFDQWLRRESDRLAAEREGTIHYLFMLRDGHLPHIVHQAGGGDASVARVEISRFAAIAASLTSRETYDKQWSLEFGLNPTTLARQMLFDEDEIARLVGDPSGDAEMVEASLHLRDELRNGQRQKLTKRRARARADRLISHIRAAVDPQPGDTLMLVDLGYHGSAQDRVDTLLADAFDVHVAGRYLLLREMSATGLDKKGLIDARHYDPELLDALCNNVAVIEQLATCELGSVVDYSETGEPIRRESSVKGAQSDVRDRVQAGAVRFASAVRASPIIRQQDQHAERGWREAALAVLARFMFLPQSEELAAIKSFEHDVNLGSERMVALFDTEVAREGMRRRGLFYMKGSERMFLPAELAQEDINTRLSLLVQSRFGLGISYTDSASQNIEIPVIYVGSDKSSQTLISATPTHEGFYTARLPIVPGADAIALQVGSVFEWFELVGITRSPTRSLKGANATDEKPRRVAAQFDALTEHASGLFECSNSAAFVLVKPPSFDDGGDTQMLEVVFRPLRRRTDLQAGMKNPVAFANRQDPATQKDAAA